MYAIEDANESVSTVHLRIIKEAIIDEMSERKEGFKKCWIAKCLKDKQWLIDKKMPLKFSPNQECNMMQKSAVGITISSYQM